jgi:hypothetical protein
VFFTYWYHQLGCSASLKIPKNLLMVWVARLGIGFIRRVEGKYMVGCREPGW